MKKGIPSTMNDEWQLNLHKTIEYAARINPTTEVISDRRAQGGKVHKLNYKLIYERVCAISNALERELDVREGDIIGIIDWNDHRYFESFYSVPSLASVLLTLNFRLHPTEILHIINHCKARGLFIDESLLQLAELLSKEYKFDFIVIMSDKPIEEIKTSLSGKVYGYEELIKSYPTQRNFEEIDEKAAAIAAFTSGTTGLPKGVFYSHRSITLHAMTVAKDLDLKPTDVMMQVVPMFHATGWGTPFAATISGGKQIYPGRFTVETLVEHMITHKVTMTAGVPTIMLEILRRIEKMEPKPDLKGLKLLVGGSEPPLSLVREFGRYAAEVQQGYGATETSPLVSFGFPKPEIDNLPIDEKFQRMKQGLIAFGIEVKLVDPVSGKELPSDGKSIGELWLRGPWIAKTYYNDPRAAERFTPDGWWKSGDAGVIDELGYIKLVDRLKDVIKSGGEWISSIDLENFLMTHPYVLEATVIGVPHHKWGERPLAFVVLRQEAKGKDLNEIKEELRNHLLKRFAKWQLPDDFIFLDEIPKTSVGKFKKDELKKKYQDYFMKQ